MSVPEELKDLRERFRRSLADCAAVLDCSLETYRQSELGNRPISGGELARLADSYGMPLMAAFPSYRPTADELALIRHMSRGVAVAAA